MSMDGFWVKIDGQLGELKTARTADDVIRILSPERNPYGDGARAGDGFFAGSGGDGTVWDSLHEAGWTRLWARASYWYAATAPDGSVITYIEGDIYKGDKR